MSHISSSEAKATILKKSIAILDTLADAAKPMRFTDLVNAAGLSKSSAHRILAMLVDESLLAFDERARTYRLGFKTMSWALKSWNDFDLQICAEEDMIWLNRQTDEHVVLAVLDKTEIVFIKKIESHAPLTMRHQVGDRAPAYCTALGKAMLAYLPREQLDALLESRPLAKMTEYTIVDPTALERELETVRQRGFAVVDREEQMEVRGIAAPIFDFEGNVVGAVNVWGHVFNISLEKLMSWAPLVVQAAGSISHRLGHRPG